MAGLFDDTQDTTSPVENNLFDDTQLNTNPIADPDAGDFIPGVKRGLQNLQAMSYGAGALAGSGLKKMGAETAGQKLQDIGMEGYKRNVEEAKLYPKKHSFKDIYTGKTGIGGAVDWAQGTLGELVPSMVEAATGAAIGSAVAPGPGTAAGAFAGRTLMKKGIEKTVEQAMKKGVGKLTEAEVRKQATRQALRKAGGKVGIGAAVMPMESGGNYAGLLEEKGIDAPETALLFGALSTSLEFLGGNSKLVDTFIDALGNGAAGMAKKSAKEILTNIPQEALQEGGQELFSILNTVANTDEKLLTAENVESIIESMAAGAVGGGAGSAISAATNNGPSVEEQLAQETVNVNPTEGQKEKGNYKKAPIKIDGFDIAIENPFGTTRKGTDPDGTPWESEMAGHYGYIKKSEGNDGDQVDVILKPGTRTSPNIFVVDQIDPNTGEFDEHKIVMGAQNLEDAQQLYLSNYPEGWQGLSNITPMGQNEFKVWLDDDKTTNEPVAKTRQDKQVTYEGLFGQPIINDAEQSAQAIEANAEQQEAILNQILQEKDLTKRQELQDTYNQMFQTFEQNAQDSAQVIETQDLGQFDQIVQDKDKDRLNTVLESIVIEPDQQARQTLYEDLFMQPGVKDAAESAELLTGEGTLANQQKQELQRVMTAVIQESDPVVRQKLYNDMFLQPGVKNAETAAEVIDNLDYQQAQDTLTNKGTPYKDINALMRKIDALPNAENYEIIETNDGFVGRLVETPDTAMIDQQGETGKIFGQPTQKGSRIFPDLNQGEAADSTFTNEQKPRTFPQFQNATTQEVNESLDNESISFIPNEGESNTSLGNILNQVKDADGITGQLANFLGSFINKSKLDIDVIIDPNATSASYTGGKINTITLRDSAQLATSLHEITHAVTVREMKANKKIQEQVKLLMTRVKNKAIKEAILTPAQAELLSTVKTSREYKENLSNEFKYDNISYGLLNENEFLAQAMGNEQFQRLLKATTIADKGTLRNAWDAFVEIVMKTLGIEQTNKNAFGETLSIIAKLAEQENVSQTEQTTNEALAVDQKIPQAVYDDIYNQKNNLVKELAQQARIKLTETRLLADRALGSISTRLKNVDPELSEHLRWLDFNTSQKVIDVLKTAKPILDITNGTKNALGIKTGGMSAEDKSAWNWARLNSDEGKIEQLAQKYNMTEQLASLREKLNGIRKDAQEVGYDVGFIEEYWPRVIKDQEGFLQATQEISQRPVFTEAIREQAKKLGISQEQFERDFPEVKADIISNLILGQSSGIGGPGNIQSRVFETIDPEYAKFYMDADAALMQYVYSMTKKIEARKFFGKVPKRISDLKSAQKRKQADLIKYEQLADMARAENPEVLREYEDRLVGLNEDITVIDEKLNAYKLQRDYTENIGSYIDRMMTEGKIQKKDEKMVRDILDARFHEHGTTGIVNAYKNLSYIDTMGSPLSAITQIGDLAWAMYVGKVWTPRGFVSTGKNLAKAIAGKSNITKEDLGIERIAQEFADGTTLSKAVNKVFKVVGLEKIDSIGKEVLINNALDNYKAEARANPEALARKIRPTFGNKSADVVQDILANTESDNVKMMLYSRLLDFQPVALSEMPELYLNSGNGRVFYMLKTYTIKQFDVFRKEVVHNLKSDNPQQKIQGITNMVQLMGLLTIANATTDEMKDFMLGKETKFSDNVIENFLTIGGASRYTRMQVSREGFGSAITQQILPPMKFVNSASKDIAEGYSSYVSGDVSNFDNARIIDSLPVGGKIFYWHYGRGNENKKSLEEQEFSKAGKDARLFKKQLENSNDKRLFIDSNIDRFKSMKLHTNFQAALSRNKAVINKLEKIPSTVNVQTRLGQLKNQREQILKKYFEVAESMK